jgi:hypothetical protein
VAGAARRLQLLPVLLLLGPSGLPGVCNSKATAIGLRLSPSQFIPCP